MHRSVDSRGVALLAVALVWAAFVTLIGAPEVILFTVPVFMLAAPLALGRYVGERLITAAGIRRSERPAGPPPSGGLVSAAVAIRGSLLLASHLAGRAPPAAPA
jgi:hypothetical protein